MPYYRYRPAFPLAAYISCLWYSEGFEGTHARERLLPNGESGIVFDLREKDWNYRQVSIYDPDDPMKVDLHAPAVFCGARTDCFVIETSAQERVIGIQFEPGGAFPFLAMPASEVAGDTYELSDAWGTEAALLRERLLAAAGIRAMFVILENALLERLEKHHALHPAVAYAARQLNNAQNAARVADVTGQIGMSARRFGDLFREQTGLTPKAFHRVRRFQQVLQRLRRQRDANWAALALDCGYYDQAHFIHDFKQFAGMTPGEYLLIATPHLNHVPMK
jgi:AraC-like DNA-binding protein